MKNSLPTRQTRRILGIAALTAICGLPLSAAAQNCDFLNPPPVTDDPDAAGIDSNGDGIDGMACGPIFVSPFGLDSNPGTRDLPMRTVAAAAVAAILYSPPRDVYIASWNYAEPVKFKGAVRVFGGFDPATWARSSLRPTIEAASTPLFVECGAYPDTTSLSFLRIHATRNPAVAGSSSVCIAKDLHNGILSLTDCVLAADAGVTGAAGAAGAGGAVGSNGSGGANGAFDSGDLAPGGNGGSNTWGSEGGHGGYGVWAAGGTSGDRGNTFESDGRGGSGGPGGGPAGNCFSNGAPGGDGGYGNNRENGAGGAGGGVAATGTAGASGVPGNGGGGGGGGGGGYNGVFCIGDTGGGGGGGGQGGQGGFGGAGGGSGGSSVAVFMWNGTLISDAATTLTAGNGSAGGQGGRGGVGGLGGAGGPGGNNGGGGSQSASGGVGRDGGAGGFGGPGGGGGGGYSAGVLRSPSGTYVVSSSTIATAAPGAGGAAGALNPGQAAGNAGTAGLAGNNLTVISNAVINSIIGISHAPTAVHCRIVCANNTPSAPTAALALDPDTDIAPAGYSLLTAAITGGAASRPGPNQFVFTPSPGFSGWTSFPIRAADTGGRTVDGYAVVYVAPPTCPGDYDHDGTVAPADVSLFINTWFTGLTQGTLAGDFDHSGQVDPADVSAFISAWFAALVNGC